MFGRKRTIFKGGKLPLTKQELIALKKNKLKRAGIDFENPGSAGKSSKEEQKKTTSIKKINWASLPEDDIIKLIATQRRRRKKKLLKMRQQRVQRK